MESVVLQPSARAIDFRRGGLKKWQTLSKTNRADKNQEGDQHEQLSVLGNSVSERAETTTIDQSSENRDSVASLTRPGGMPAFARTATGLEKFMKFRKRLQRRSSQTSTISTDEQEDDSDAVLDKAFEHTRKFRVKSLVANALVMEQKNKIADRNRVVVMKKRANRNKVRALYTAAMQPKLFHVTKKLPVSPYVKFRRMVRAVKLLIQVCHVCSELVMQSVTSESWFALMDNIVVATTTKAKKKRDRQFVTFVPNEKRQLEQLTFDVNDFKRDSLSEELLTDEVKSILEKIPGTRTPDDVVKVLRCLKAISRPFNNYPLYVQKRISQCAFYDKYNHNRVIIKKGHIADGMFFLLSGSLMEKADGKKHPYHINIGDIFGEEDLLCGSYRRHTVITRMPSEMLYLHREDYRAIFEMAEDANDPKNLEICKQNIIFQHFPLNRLIENPSTWSTLHYKHGRCIVKDSNDVEWIYVIRSGEARIFKHLDTTVIDITTRRKKVQKAEQEQCVFFKKRQILDFEANRDNIKSTYRPASYHPGRRLNSAPPTNGHRRSPGKQKYQSVPVTPSSTSRKVARVPSVMSRAIDEISKAHKAVTFPKLQDDNEDQHLKPIRSNTSLSERLSDSDDVSSKQESTCRMASVFSQNNFIRTPFRRKPKIIPASSRAAVPPFVQIETLHYGDVFGLRACLDEDERGPSVSLVSGECEVVQINKKFFMKHCDDALYSLIRLKAKPYPTEEECIDRLDANIQWEEYKQQTLRDFFNHRSLTAR